jgi:hypothetical protein
MQKLFNLSQQYYNAQFQAHQISSGTAFGIQDMIPSSLEAFSQSEFFWTKIKSGIYFLKKNSDYLAWPELNEATRMIPLLCETQPLSLLREIYGALSPVTTRVRLSVRTNILQIFRQNALTKLGPMHIFSEICQILCTEGGVRRVVYDSSESHARYFPSSPYTKQPRNLRNSI